MSQMLCKKCGTHMGYTMYGSHHMVDGELCKLKQKLKRIIDKCGHPSADKIDGKWFCGICECELDEKMSEQHNLTSIERDGLTTAH